MTVVVNEALTQLGKKANISIIGNPRSFRDYGVKKNMTLMINDEILAEGLVPRLDEMKIKLTSYLT